MEIKQLQAILLAMMKKLDIYLKETDIKYSLAYGSHLGAIRHKGFIPWDDDVDIFMLPEDFKRLRSLAVDNDMFKLDSKETSVVYPLLFDKVILKQSKATVEGFDMFENTGVFIDVFPLYYVPDTFFKRIYMYTLLSLMKYINLIIILNAEKYRKGFPGKLAHLLINIFKINNVGKVVKKIQDRLLRFERSEYVVDIELKPLKKYKTEWFENILNVEFEDTKFDIPSSEELLSIVYGDYMKIPEVTDRTGHSDIIFEVSEEMKHKLGI